MILNLSLLRESDRSLFILRLDTLQIIANKQEFEQDPKCFHSRSRLQKGCRGGHPGVSRFYKPCQSIIHSLCFLVQRGLALQGLDSEMVLTHFISQSMLYTSLL